MTAALLIVLATLAPAYTPYTTSQGATVHWDTDLLCYAIGSNPPADLPLEVVEAELDAALHRWTDLACAPKQLRYDGRVDVFARDPTPGSGNTLVWVHDAAIWAGAPNQYALTTLTARRVDGILLDVDLELNVGTYHFSAADTCQPGFVDLANTLTHEAGHIMGLDHSTVFGATLYTTAEPCDTFMRDLSDDDVEGYCWLATAFPPTGQVSPCDPGVPDTTDAAEAETGAPDTGAEAVVEVDAGQGGGGCGVAFGPSPAAAWLVLIGLLGLSRVGSRTRS